MNLLKNIPSYAGWLLLSIALGLYLFGMYKAIYLSLQIDVTKLLDALDNLTSTIGAILLTNLGAVLGIAISTPSSGLAGKTLVANTSNSPLNKNEMMQYVCVLLYLSVLIACFITWGCKDFSSETNKVIPIVSQCAKTLIGVITAYISFMLGSKPLADNG